MAASDETSHSDELASLIDRISNRLGHDVVFAARLRSSPLPESAYAMIPLTGPRTSSARLRAGLDRIPAQVNHRPLQLLSPPLRIEIRATEQLQEFACQAWRRKICRVWGPERIETSWWQGPSIRRDYYRVLCTLGDRYWLFHDLSRQHWYLHGIFA